MKITSHVWTSSLMSWHGMAPSSLSELPLERLRFAKWSAGRSFSVRCFWRLQAIASPIDPRPNHPNRGIFIEDMVADQSVDVWYSQKENSWHCSQKGFTYALVSTS
jgi:hypothetical protein